MRGERRAESGKTHGQKRAGSGHRSGSPPLTCTTSINYSQSARCKAFFTTSDLYVR